MPTYDACRRTRAGLVRSLALLCYIHTFLFAENLFHTLLCQLPVEYAGCTILEDRFACELCPVRWSRRSACGSFVTVLTSGGLLLISDYP